MAPGTVIFGGVEIPSDVSVVTTTTIGGRGLLKMFAKFTLVHPIDGALNFLVGDIGFIPDQLSSSPPVYAAVASWDAFRSLIAMDGQTREWSAEIELQGDAVLVPSNGTKRYKVSDLIQQCQICDVPIQFVQWSERDNSQIPVWRGACSGMPVVRYTAGSMVVGLGVTSYDVTTSRKAVRVVDKTSYPLAPVESVGLTIPLWNGNIITGMDTGAKMQEAVFLGFGSRFVRGVLVNENLGSLQAQYDFHVNNGSRNAAKIDVGTPGDPGDPCAVWIYSGGNFYMVDASNIVITNDTGIVSAKIPLQPTVWLAIHPSTPGSYMDAGIQPSAFAMTNDNPNDYYETSSATGWTIAFEMPSSSLPGFFCNKATVMVDVGTSDQGAVDVRTFDWGLVDMTKATPGAQPYFSAYTGWFGLAGKFGRKTVAVGPGGDARRRYYVQTVGPPAVKQYYDSTDANNHVGAATAAEFNQANICGRDVNGNLVPVQLFFTVSSEARDRVRFFGSALLLQGKLQIQKMQRTGRKWGWIGTPGSNSQHPVLLPEDVPVSGVPGYEVLLTGWGQKDSGTAWNNGNPEDPIERATGVVREILEVAGMTCNNVAGTLGNFQDALTEELQGEKFLSPVMQPDTAPTFQDFIDEIQRHTPIEVHKDENGVYNVTYDVMNPHSSQIYPGGPIHGYDIEEGSFSVQASDPRKIVNRVALRYGHAYGTNKPLGIVRYVHQLSVEIHGSRDEVTYDEPWITAKDLSLSAGDPPEASFRAKDLGTRNARVRLTTTQSLGQRYRDLRVGHVLWYATDMESYGLKCPAFRCGQFDYAYPDRSDPVNYAQSVTPNLTIVIGGNGETLFGLSQMTDHLDLYIATPGSLIVTGWTYYSDFVGGFENSNFLTNVVNPNAVKSAGHQRVSWDMPSSMIGTWRKQILVFNGIAHGPCYWIGMPYINSTVAAVGSAKTTYDPTWAYRVFRVIEATRKAGKLGDYPKMDVVLEEVA